jgi:hypothetical protein
MHERHCTAMNAITDYKLCRGTEGQLEKLVHDALRQGWQPHGSPVASGDDLVQALVKRGGEGGAEDIEMVPRKPGPAEEAL